MEVKTLVMAMDSITARYKLRPGSTLFLGGTEDSKFLKAVERKVAKYGAEVKYVTNSPSSYLKPETWSLIVDNESDAFKGYSGPFPGNIDAGMGPAVAEAVHLILQSKEMISGKSITIVGRGKSVHGLAEALIKEDATVTVAHTKTSDMKMALLGADVIILATPEISEAITHVFPALTIDIGGAVEKYIDSLPYEYIGMREVGSLCTSILANRFVLAHSEGL